MVKQQCTPKQKQRQRSKQKTIEHKSTKYVCVLNNKKVVVKTKRTAHGQQQIAGVFDVVNRTWQKGNKNTPLPNQVKIKVEDIF